MKKVSIVTTIAWLTVFAAPTLCEESRKLPPGAIAYLGPADQKDNEARQVEFSRDGKYLWVRRIETISLIETEYFKTVWELKPPPWEKKGPRFWWHEFRTSPDGKTFLAVRSDNTIQIWDFATRRELSKIDPPDEQRQVALAIYLSNRVLLVAVSRSASSRGLVYTIDFRSKKELQRTDWAGDTSHPSDVHFDSKSRLSIYGIRRPYWLRVQRNQQKLDEILKQMKYGLWGLSQDHSLLAHLIPVSVDSDPQLANWPDPEYNPPLAVTIVSTATGSDRTKLPVFIPSIGGTYLEVFFSRDNRSCLTVHRAGRIQLWEIGSGKERLRFPRLRGGCVVAALSPDSNSVATVGSDGVLVWSLSAVPAEKNKKMQLDLNQFKDLWSEFTDTDAQKSFRADAQLTAAANAVELVSKVGHEPTALNQRLNLAIGNLDSVNFTIRESATADLIAMGEVIRPTLRHALMQEGISPESSRRLRQILAKWPAKIEGPATLDELRAIRLAELLERIATNEARQLLEMYATKYKGEALGDEARASLARLGRKK